MNRRGFLQALSTSAAAMVLDPERLLWRPGAKKIFLPSPKLALPADAYGQMLIVTSGPMAGEMRRITEYNPTSHTFTFAAPFSQPIKPYSDTFMIVPA